jgi:predicted helicase
MPTLTLKPTHKAVTAYYESLAKFEQLGVKHETAVRSAIQELLEHCARQFDWKLVPEYPIKRKGQADAKADAALLDNYGLNHGLWEAKDSDDDLEKEIKHKFSVGYPKQNILFWQPDRAVLYQNNERFYEADLKKPEDLVHILALFLEFAPPAIAEWEKAVEQFKDKIPQIGARLKELIEAERQANKKFIAAFDDFCSLCRGSLNPNISVEAVEEMIIQHILTERIFRKIFDVADFISRNVIAQEIEKVITALNSRVFSRDDFSKKLEHFYGAIENAAATITDFHEKQTFLNTVYERFFQGFCVKVADTHGIVYTPQPLVNFMVASVEQVLKGEFGKSLADSDVHILDPFTGTGNFIVNIMRRIPKSALPQKYADELHCNEVMLLPYYVASMNIEHAYLEATGKYQPFEGICLVDTFQTYEGAQAELAMLSEKNSKRVERQKKSPIKVIMANPPYNAGQADENDNNKNRKYRKLDERVSNTYAADSNATLLRKLSDPYVRAIRQATDRIGDAGIVCFVNNNSFVADFSFDGMRKHLVRDFDLIYVLDLGGNVRKGQSGNGNVFGIMVGVSINLFIKLPRKNKGVETRSAKIKYFELPDEQNRKEKFAFLKTKQDVAAIKWKLLKPDDRHDWFPSPTDAEFASFIPISSKDAKAGVSVPTVFRTYSLGISTNRDSIVYDFNVERLTKRVEKFADDYNMELHRWLKKGKPEDVDNFVNYEKIKWSRNLKRWFRQEEEMEVKKGVVRSCFYRPFNRMNLFYGRMFVDEFGTSGSFFPDPKIAKQNKTVCLTGPGSEKPFMSLVANGFVDLHFAAFGCGTQCFPLFTYSEEGSDKRDNITPKAKTLFQIFYDDDAITREKIFYYVYAVLHHPAYRTRFAENLKRDLPRIPFIGVAAEVRRLKSPPVKFYPLSAVEKMQGNKTPDHNPAASAKIFHAFAETGRKLADLHVNYESVKEFKLERIENKGFKLDWRVEAMKLTKDKSSIIYNDFLTLSGIPPEVFDYKLGNRSALEWVIDQYRVSKDDQGNITGDPNRIDDEQYIVRLIGQVITVSLETQKLITSLPPVESE